MQERRPPLKIHFTIQLGYFTGVKKEEEGGCQSLFQYNIWPRLFTFYSGEWGNSRQEGIPSCFTLPPSYSKNDFTTRTIISESHLKSCLLFALPYKSISLLFLMGYNKKQMFPRGLSRLYYLVYCKIQYQIEF